MMPMIWVAFIWLLAFYLGGCTCAALVLEQPDKIDKRVEDRVRIGMMRNAAELAVARSIIVTIIFWPLHIKKAGRLI